jgi:hypothetical protein
MDRPNATHSTAIFGNPSGKRGKSSNNISTQHLALNFQFIVNSDIVMSRFTTLVSNKESKISRGTSCELLWSESILMKLEATGVFIVLLSPGCVCKIRLGCLSLQVEPTHHEGLWSQVAISVECAE